MTGPTFALSVLIFPLITANLATDSEFECAETRSRYTDGSNFLYPRSMFPERDRGFDSASQQKLFAPCFNASYPTSLSVEEGSNVTLPCVVHNVDFNSIVMSWWKDKAVREISVGDNLVDAERFSIDKSVRGGWSLRIYNVSLEDNGVYICQINSKHLRERFISLSVSAKRRDAPSIPNNDVLVKDEAMHVRQSPSGNIQGSVWKPFIGYDWNRNAETTTSPAPHSSLLLPSTFPLLLFLLTPPV